MQTGPFALSAPQGNDPLPEFPPSIKSVPVISGAGVLGRLPSTGQETLSENGRWFKFSGPDQKLSRSHHN